MIAGWTGRDQAAVERHIAELAAIGVARPLAVPCFYRVGANLLTTSPPSTSPAPLERRVEVVLRRGRSLSVSAPTHRRRSKPSAHAQQMAPPGPRGRAARGGARAAGPRPPQVGRAAPGGASGPAAWRGRRTTTQRERQNELQNPKRTANAERERRTQNENAESHERRTTTRTQNA